MAAASSFAISASVFQRTANDVRDGVDGDNLRIHTSRKSARDAFVRLQTLLETSETLFKVSDLVILLQKSFAHGDDFFVGRVLTRNSLVFSF